MSISWKEQDVFGGKSIYYFLDTACMSLCVCVFLSVLIRYTDEFVCFQVLMVRCLILYSVLVLMHCAHVRLLRGSFMKCHSFDCSYGSEL